MTAAVDQFASFTETLGDCYNACVAITPSDTRSLTNVTRGLIFTGAGNLKIVDNAGNTSTIIAPSPGVILKIRASQVFATGTTVTNIFGLY